jgi:hypothetical protein
MLTEIISGLWIGDSNDSLNSYFYKDNLIDIVINCTIEKPFINHTDIHKVRLPISSNITPERDIILLQKNMNKIVDYIYNHSTKNIFIHCYNGLNISPLIVAMYIIKYGDISKDLIHDVLRSKNKNICLDYNLSLFQ